MQSLYRGLLLSAIVLLASGACHAGQIKAYVAPFAVTGAANRDDLKGTLQNLLMSRLSGDTVITVENAASADVSITGSYVAFGQVFSIDTVAKSSDGRVLVRAFEQGERQEEVLSAVAKLAKSLLSGIDKNYNRLEAVTAPLAAVANKEPVISAPSKDIVRVDTANNPTGSGWISRRLEGELTGVALGRKLANGEREIFVTGNRKLQYYRQGKELLLLSEITLPGHQKILGIDTADLDNDGIPEIYLTIMSGEDLASEVWLPEGSSLKKAGEKLPYYFRGLRLPGKSKKIYAQQAGRDVDYFGDLYEVKKNGLLFDISNPLQLPRGANIFNIGMVMTREGKSCFIVLHPDGYLLVFDDKGKNLWTSSDKYGGSENFFAKEDPLEMRNTGTAQRKIFMQQRITITSNGEIIVPKNDGFFTIGNNRSYSKNTVFAFNWNGIVLDELWHTKDSQNYLADYQFDDAQKELVLLEVVKKEGIIDKGASALSIKKVQ